MRSIGRYRQTERSFFNDEGTISIYIPYILSRVFINGSLELHGTSIH